MYKTTLKYKVIDAKGNYSEQRTKTIKHNYVASAPAMKEIFAVELGVRPESLYVMSLDRKKIKNQDFVIESTGHANDDGNSVLETIGLYILTAMGIVVLLVIAYYTFQLVVGLIYIIAPIIAAVITLIILKPFFD